MLSLVAQVEVFCAKSNESAKINSELFLLTWILPCVQGHIKGWARNNKVRGKAYG